MAGTRSLGLIVMMEAVGAMLSTSAFPATEEPGCLVVTVHAVLPLDPRNPKVVVRYHHRDVGVRARTSVNLPGGPGELVRYKHILVLIDGMRPAPRVLDELPGADPMQSGRVVLKAGETYDFPFELKRAFRVPENWKRIEIVPSSMLLEPAVRRASLTLEHVDEGPGVSAAQDSRIAKSEDLPLVERFAAIDRLGRLELNRGIQPLVALEEATRTDPTVHYQVLRALYDNCRRGFGQVPVAVVAGLARNRAVGLHGRALCLELLAMARHETQAMAIGPALPFTDEERRLAQQALEAVAAEKPRDDLHARLIGHAKRLLGLLKVKT